MEFCNQVKHHMKLLGNQLVCVSEHSFYKTPPEDSNSQNYNWDHPEAVDFELFYNTLNSLKLGKNVEIAVKKHSPHDSENNKNEEVYGADVLLVVGTLVLYEPKLRELMDLKVFIDADQDNCLVRRLRRDVFGRKFDCKDVLQKYNDHVKPGYNAYILPTKQFANVIVPCRSKLFDEVSIALISQFISTKLKERDQYELTLEIPKWSSPPSQVHIMPQTQLIRSLSTILRNEKTPLVDFIFHTDRLSRLLAEFALDSVIADMYKPDEGKGKEDMGVKEVVTPTGSVYTGVKLDYSKVSVVSIMRAGEALENGVREVIKDIKIGKMLIQSENKAPRLFYCSLHNIISPDAPVLLLDATLATGSTVKMAVRVLLDHGVQEKNIYFLTIVSSPQGVHSVLKTYSQLNIFTATMDEDLDERLYISPGIGNFGDRYFGT
uniref:uracil phosphoribosyltransferase n=1 Tax=Paramoeba aestuarina TaxID=180227 RepID=A0A7S4L306_9EUKA